MVKARTERKYPGVSPAADVGYRPKNPSQWGDDAPATVQEALDRLSGVDSRIFYIADPTASDDLPIWSPPWDIEILEVAAWTDTSTLTFNIEERSTPAGSGVDVMTSDMAADSTGETDSSPNNPNIDADDWLAYVASAAGGSATELWIRLKYRILP